MIRIPALSIAVAIGALAVAGCGSSNKSSSSNQSSAPASTPTTTAPSSGGSGGGSGLKLSADPSGQLKFDTSSLSAKAGKVTITMDNPSPVSHSIAVEGNGVDKKGQTVGQGGNSTISVSLKPGKYTFYCPVDGHRQAGMQGTLTVK